MAVTCLACYPPTLPTLSTAGPSFPRYRRWQEPVLGSSTAGPFCAILWQLAALGANRNWLSHGPASGTGCQEHPAMLGWGSAHKEEAPQQRQYSARGWHSQGERLKPRVVRRWGTVMTAREREKEVDSKFKSGKRRKIFTGSTDGSSFSWASTCLQGLAEHSEAPNASIISMRGTSAKIKSFSSWKLKLPWNNPLLFAFLLVSFHQSFQVLGTRSPCCTQHSFH